MTPPKKFVPDGVVRSFTLQGRSLKDWLLCVQGRMTIRESLSIGLLSPLNIFLSNQNIRGGKMKPVVMYALSKELQGYIKSVQRLDRSNLLEINKRLLKMQLEVSEIMEKIT